MELLFEFAKGIENAQRNGLQSSNTRPFVENNDGSNSDAAYDPDDV